MSEKYYIFTVYIGGFGTNPEDAWADARDNLDPMDLEQPTTHTIDFETDNDEGAKQ